MIVMGLDPGIASFGWSVIESPRRDSMLLLDCGVIKTTPAESIGDRLCIINDALVSFIKKYNPEHAVIEQLFFAKNVKTAAVVGEARGVAILACASQGLNIVEFTPLQVKQALTGYGQATKSQVGYMVEKILGLKKLPRDDNTVDAIALAVCFIHSYKNL